MKKISIKKSLKKCKKKIKITLDLIIENRGKVSLVIGIIGCIISFYYGKNTATKKDIISIKEKVEQIIQLEAEKTREELHSFIDGFAENTSPEEPLREEIKKADLLFHEKRFKEAYNLYDEISKKALSSNKENLFLLSLMGKGISIGEQGDYQRALEILNNTKEYENLLDKKAKVKLYFNLGYCNQILKNNDLAIKDYSKALNFNPKLYTIYYNRGNVYYDKGEYNRAIQDFGKAIVLEPKYARFYNNRGSAYAKKGDYNRAIQDYNKAVTLNSEYAGAYFNRGLTYYDMEEYNRAIQDYNKAIELYPAFADAYCNRGLAYYKKSDYDKAIQDCNKTIMMKPGNAPAYYNCGKAYEKKKNNEKAIEAYKNFIEIASDWDQKRIEHAKERIKELQKEIDNNSQPKNSQQKKEDKNFKKEVTMESLLGVILGFFLGWISEFTRNRTTRQNIIALLFKEILSTYEQINYTYPVENDGNQKPIVLIDTSLVASIGESLSTRIYESSLSDIYKLSEPQMESIIEAYTSIYQFKKYSVSLKELPQESKKDIKEMLQNATVKAAEITFKKCGSTLNKISPERFKKVKPILDGNRGKFIQQTPIQD